MTTGLGPRIVAVASATFRGAFAGAAGLGIVAAGLVLPLVVGAIASAHFAGLDLLATSETLYSTLFLPVIVLLVCLIVGVGLFRGELEEDTLVYPLNRTLPRPALVVGKYLGFLAAALVVLLPSALFATGLAAAWGSGPTLGSPALLETIALLTVLAVLAYGAFFLLLGLLTRQALVIGLLYGFIWETFVSVIAGPIRQLTIVYYLRGAAASLLSSGPLASGPSGVSVLDAVVGLGLMAAASVAVAAAYLQYVEVVPSAAPG